MTDLPELTREEAIAEMERLATELYHAEDLIAFIQEQLDHTTGPIEPAQLQQWLNYTGCAYGEPHAGPSADSLARILRHTHVSALPATFRELGWRMDFDIAARVTDHTFEGTPGLGNRCETDRFGQVCGAPWEQHELREEWS